MTRTIGSIESTPMDSHGIKILGGTVLALYTIAVTSFWTSFLLQYLGECKTAYYVCVIFGYPGMDLAFSLLLWLFVFRLIKRFNNTKYAIPKCQKNTILLFTGIAIFCIIIANTVSNAVPDVYDTDSIAYIILLTGLLLYYFLTFTMSLIVLKLFISKLHLLIHDFLKQFGAISQTRLHDLNKSLRFAIWFFDFLVSVLFYFFFFFFFHVFLFSIFYLGRFF